MAGEVGQPSVPPTTLVDPTTGRPILMAPQRHQRPVLTADGASQWPCPFCPGNEAWTPPEVDAAREPGSAPDQPGWSVRAFANKYPAARHHEVIAEGAAHEQQPADLDVATWRTAIAVWQRRIRALELLPDVACAYLFKNVGHLAGASIAHNHSQLLGLATLPPRLELELQQAAALPSCPWCRTIASAGAEQRLIAETAQHVVLAPQPPKLPYETWLLPKSCDDDFLATDADSLAAALQALFTAVRDGLSRPAFNLWLHRDPQRRLHWHFEMQPRTGQLAALELGGDMYMNSLPAAQAALLLRRALEPQDANATPQ